MLSDIFQQDIMQQVAGVKPGDSVVIYGAGPVGLMAAHSASIKGASKIMVVDNHPDRLKLAEELGAVQLIFKRVSSRASTGTHQRYGCRQRLRMCKGTSVVINMVRTFKCNHERTSTGRKSNWFYRCCRGLCS
jgi:threonine dehydrogenase-like Zn-dependent dehydrogenase